MAALQAAMQSSLRATAACTVAPVAETSSRCHRPAKIQAPSHRLSFSSAASDRLGCFRPSSFSCNALKESSCVDVSRVQMTSGETVAQGYAKALLELALSGSALEAVHNDAEKLSGLFQNKSLADFLSNPVIEATRKKAILATLGQDAGFNRFTQNFLYLLVDKKRIGLLPEALKIFDDLYCEASQTETAVVTSSVKLDNAQQALIAKKLQAMTGAKNIKLKNVVDASLIAGFVLQYGKNGSRFIDMSVKGQLDRLAAEFVESARV